MRGADPGNSSSAMVVVIAFGHVGNAAERNGGMRVVLAGGHGQLGSDLAPALRAAGMEAIPLGRGELDLTGAASIIAALDEHRPEYVINCAAWNRVDDAEQEVEAAFDVNAIAAGRLAGHCRERGIRLMHVSTDHVFSGRDGNGVRSVPYTEEDLPEPPSVYGCSKLAGEHLVRAGCPEAVIVRTCGLYGRQATRSKGNFVQTMLRLGAEREELTVVDDQRCSPTSTVDLAAAVVALCQREAAGLFHVTSTGDATWCEFARAIMDLAGLPCQVRGITSAEYGAKAARPWYSVLSTGKFTRTTEVAMPSWRESLQRYLAHAD